MASHCHPQKTVHFFKVILKCMLSDGVLRIPSDFTRKYGGFLPNPVFLKPPDGTKWKIFWKKHDGDIWFEKGWKEFATYYSLDHWYFLSFKYDGTCNLEVVIFNVTALEIEYPSHVIDDEDDNLEKFSDDSIEFLGEGPPHPKARPRSPLSDSGRKLRSGKIRATLSRPNLKKCQTHNVRDKSPLLPLRPCKKMRACTNGEDKSTSNLQKKPINGELSGRKLRSGKIIATERSPDMKKCQTHNREKSPLLRLRPCKKMRAYTNGEDKSTSNLQKKPIYGELSGRKLRSGKIRATERSPNLKKCQTHNVRDKSPLLPIRPCKKMRACANGEDKSTSNLQKKPINGELIQVEGRSNFSTRKCSNSLAIRSSKSLTEVEKARALQRVSTFSSKYPHFKRIIQPSYVSRPSLRSPSHFFKQHLKKKQGAVLLQAWDGRTWSSTYKVSPLGNQVYISDWRAFAKDNFVEVGDVCVFELTHTTKATLRVTISRPSEQPFFLVNSVSAQRDKSKARKKSPLLPLRPSKKMRACTNGEDESISSLQKKPVNRELVQVEGSSEFSAKKYSNFLAIGRSKALTEVEKSRALQRVSTFSSEYPHFKRVMQPSYVSKNNLVSFLFETHKCIDLASIACCNCKPSSFLGTCQFNLVKNNEHLKLQTIPSQFCKQHLKKKHGALLLQDLDGRTWSTRYKVGPKNDVYISGWKAFAKDNYVEVGDVCVFELIQRSKNTLRVTISRPAEQPTCLGDSDTQVIQRLPSLTQLDSTTALEETGKLNLENPSFIVTVKKCHLSAALGIPNDFLRSYVKKREQNVLIQHRKQSWPAKLLYYPQKNWGYLSTGWLSFARESQLQVGDVCVFELINRDDPVLEVYVYRCHS